MVWCLPVSTFLTPKLKEGRGQECPRPPPPPRTRRVTSTPFPPPIHTSGRPRVQPDTLSDLKSPVHIHTLIICSRIPLLAQSFINHAPTAERGQWLRRFAWLGPTCWARPHSNWRPSNESTSRTCLQHADPSLYTLSLTNMTVLNHPVRKPDSCLMKEPHIQFLSTALYMASMSHCGGGMLHN